MIKLFGSIQNPNYELTLNTPIFNTATRWFEDSPREKEDLVLEIGRKVIIQDQNHDDFLLDYEWEICKVDRKQNQVEYTLRYDTRYDTSLTTTAFHDQVFIFDDIDNHQENINLIAKKLSDMFAKAQKRYAAKNYEAVYTEPYDAFVEDLFKRTISFINNEISEISPGSTFGKELLMFVNSCCDEVTPKHPLWDRNIVNRRMQQINEKMSRKYFGHNAILWSYPAIIRPVMPY